MNCEKELTLLEKDIEKLNKPYIFVDHNIWLNFIKNIIISKI